MVRRPSPAGDLLATRDTSPSLQQASCEGHWWVVLPESLASSLKSDICAWHNQDQNENQALTDGELIRMAKMSVEKYLAKAGPGKVQLPLQEIATAACMATPLKLKPVIMGSYCKFVCQMAVEQQMPLVDEFLKFWSASVDPAQISIPNMFFDFMCKFKPLDKQGLLRMHMTMAMYCAEGSTPKAKPTPDSAGLFTAKDMESLAKQKPDVIVPLVSAGLARVHTVGQPLLQHLPVHIVREEVVAVGTLLVRLLFAKALTLEVSPGGADTWVKCPVQTGKVAEDKVNKTLGWWAKHLDTRYPEIWFSKKMGLEEHLPSAPVALPLEDEVWTVPGKRLLDKTPSKPEAPGPASEATGSAPEQALVESQVFEVGDLVALTRRCSPNSPLPGQPDYRRNMKVGAQAKVLSLEDDNHKGKSEVQFSVMVQGAPMELRTWILTDNLVLSSAAGKMLLPASGTGSSLDDTPVALPEEIANASGLGSDVQQVSDWANLLDESSPASAMTLLKAKSTFAMGQVLEVMPTVTEEDLRVVHRRNSLGAVRTEIWTASEFASGELMFGPWTHEIKDRLWSFGSAASLGVPREQVPGNRVLALDGRKRNHLGHGDLYAGVPGAAGNLFWCIQRTSERSQANMFLDYCSVSVPYGGMTVRLPLVSGGGVKTVKMNKDSLPKIPILVNKKTVPGNTMLLALEDPIIAQARAVEKEERAVEKEALVAAQPSKKQKVEKTST